MTSLKLTFLVTTMFSRLASTFTLRQASHSAAHHLERPFHNARATLSPLTVSTLPRSCPACHQPLPSTLPACSNCGSITNIPSDINYYHLLGFDYNPSQFHLDQGLLRSQFRRAQVACHPDAWTSKGQVRFVHTCINHSSHTVGKDRCCTASLFASKRSLPDVTRSVVAITLPAGSQWCTNGRNGQVGRYGIFIRNNVSSRHY